ncbi:MAG: quinone oxidoreductase family protein [Paracoccaceae bacterium]
MLVAEINEFGGPEVLKIVERPDPEAGPGEIIVDIRATSVNAADWKTRRGRSARGVALPHVLGRDFSGVVSACGSDVRFKPGDAVFGVCLVTQEGAYAEKIVISEEYITHLPEGLNHIEAAAIALAGLTAHASLIDCLKVKAGEKVLIQGGAGGVGSMAIQIAHHTGVHVGVTGRRENHEYLRALGTDETIDYRTQGVVETFGNCDAVFDCVGPATLETTFAALKSGGRAAFIGLGRTPPSPPGSDITSMVPDAYRSRERMEKLAELVQSGVIRPPFIKTMPFVEVAKAHALSETGHVRGKIVLEIG